MNIHSFLIQNLSNVAASAWRVWERTGSQFCIKCALHCEAEMQFYMSKQSDIVWG